MLFSTCNINRWYSSNSDYFPMIFFFMFCSWIKEKKKRTKMKLGIVEILTRNYQMWRYEMNVKYHRSNQIYSGYKLSEWANLDNLYLIATSKRLWWFCQNCLFRLLYLFVRQNCEFIHCFISHLNYLYGCIGACIGICRWFR